MQGERAFFFFFVRVLVRLFGWFSVVSGSDFLVPGPQCGLLLGTPLAMRVRLRRFLKIRRGFSVITPILFGSLPTRFGSLDT